MLEQMRMLLLPLLALSYRNYDPVATRGGEHPGSAPGSPRAPVSHWHVDVAPTQVSDDWLQQLRAGKFDIDLHQEHEPGTVVFALGAPIQFTREGGY
jgi:hypothetical protein